MNFLKLYPNEDTFDVAFNELDAKMQEKYNSKNSDFFRLENPYIGQPVAALYEDNKWYRAEIIDIHETNKSFNILFVDYGNKSQINLDNLRYLVPQFIRYEIQVIT